NPSDYPEGVAYHSPGSRYSAHPGITTYPPDHSRTRGSDRRPMVAEPCRIRLEPAHAHLDDSRIRHHAQRRIARMVRFLVRVVPRRVVAADQRPARILRVVLVRAVQQVAVEEQGVAGL